MPVILDGSTFTYDTENFAIDKEKTRGSIPQSRYRIVKWTETGWVEVTTFSRNDVEDSLPPQPKGNIAEANKGDIIKYAEDWIKNNWF